MLGYLSSLDHFRQLGTNHKQGILVINLFLWGSHFLNQPHLSYFFHPHKYIDYVGTLTMMTMSSISTMFPPFSLTQEEAGQWQRRVQGENKKEKYFFLFLQKITTSIDSPSDFQVAALS